MELLGNCGFSLCAPLNKYTKEDFDSWISEYTDTFDITWSDFGGYIAASKKAKATINLAFQVGHGTLRASVMGYEDRTPSADELDKMKPYQYTRFMRQINQAKILINECKPGSDKERLNMCNNILNSYELIYLV